MIYTLDSNACISHLRSRGASGVSRRLALVDNSEIVICSIVRAELLYGAVRSKNPVRNMSEVNTYLARFISVPFEDKAATHYADIRDLLARSGKPIGPNDLLIASIARANNLIVVTHNTGEFSRVPGLKIEDWESTGGVTNP